MSRLRTSKGSVDRGSSALRSGPSVQTLDVHRDIQPFDPGRIEKAYDAYGGERVNSLRYSATNGYGRSLKSTIVLEFPEWSPSGCSSDSNLASGAPGEVARQYVDALYQQLSVRVQQTGRFINFQNLSHAHTLNDWLGQYMYAYAGLNLLLSAYAAGRYNAATEGFARNIGGLVPALEADFNRLAAIPVPQGLVDLLDYSSGAFADSEDSTLLLVGGGANASHGGDQLDMLNGTECTTLLTNIENAISVCYSGGLTSVTSADCASILNLFAQLYSPPRIPKYRIKFGTKYVDPFRTMMVCAVVNAPANFIFYPANFNGTVANNETLIMVRKRGEVSPLAFTLWRPQITTVFYSGSVAGGTYASEQLGIAQKVNALTDVYTSYVVYDKEGVVTKINFLETVPNQFVRSISQDFFRWGPLVLDIAEGALPFGSIAPFLDQDLRALDDWEVVPYAISNMAVNHVKLLHDVFIDKKSIVA